jgi:hypothetical protein
VTGAIAFVALMTSFTAHLKMTASKWIAKKKIAAMEAAAEEEDKKDDAENNSNEDTKTEDNKLRKREINWEASTQSYRRWN